MARQDLIECFVGADRFVAMSTAVLEARVSVDQPQRALLTVIGSLKAFGGLRDVVGEIGDQRRVKVAECTEALVLQAVDLCDRPFVIPGAGIGPRGEQGRRDVALTPGTAL